MIATSLDSQPEWLQASVTEESGYLYFTGRSEAGRDQLQVEEQAYAQALTRMRATLREGVRTEVEAELGKKAAREEKVVRILNQSVEGLDLKGAMPLERYWERLAFPGNDGLDYAYRVAMRVRISKAQFEALRKQAHQACVEQMTTGAL